jgi:DNA-binding CsgD family transcriptional regulator
MERDRCEHGEYAAADHVGAACGEHPRGDGPTLLRDEGLQLAVEALARRAALPVTVRGTTGDRLPDPVELAAYFVVSAMQLVEEKRERVGYLMKERVGRGRTAARRRRTRRRRRVRRRPSSPRRTTRTTPPVDPLEELTSREREILALMAEGRSNQGICRTLWLSPRTVETHIRGMFAKLGIREAPEDNRRVLAVLAYLRR